MTQQYDEVVKVTWDVKDAEDNISKLIAKIDQLELKAGAAGLQAGKRFSDTFNAGMTGAFRTLNEFEARLIAIAALQARMMGTPMPDIPPSAYAGNSTTFTSSGRSLYRDFGEYGIQGGSGRPFAGPAFSMPPTEYGRPPTAPTLNEVQRASVNWVDYPLIPLGRPSSSQPFMSRPGTPPWQYEDPFMQSAFFSARATARDIVPSGPLMDFTSWGYPRQGPTSPIGGNAGINAGLYEAIRNGSIPLGGSYARSGGFAGFPGGPTTTIAPYSGIGGVPGLADGLGAYGYHPRGGPDDIPGAFFRGGVGGGGGGGGGTIDMKVGPDGKWVPGTPGLDDLGRAVKQSESQFIRHAQWMAQTLIIGAAFGVAIGAATAAVRDFTSNALLFGDVSTRLGVITGQTSGQTVQGFQLAGQYGLTPAQSAPGLIAAGQLGLGKGPQEQAAQIAQVFHAADQYQNILQELNQTQLSAQAIGLQNVDVLGYLATAYVNVNGNVETYLDALQYGIEYHKVLGLTAEEAGIAIGKMANALDTDPDTARGLLGRIKIQLNNPEIRKNLEGLGITGPTTPEYLRQLSSVVAGGGPDADAAIAQMSKGLQGQVQIGQFRLLFSALNDYYNLVDQGNAKLEKFSELQAEVANTGIAKIDMLKASWQLLYQAASQTGPMQVAGAVMSGVLDAGIKSINVLIGLMNDPMIQAALQVALLGGHELNLDAIQRGASAALLGPGASGLNDYYQQGGGSLYNGQAIGRRIPGVETLFPGGSAEGDTENPFRVRDVDELPQGVSFAQFMKRATEIQNELMQIPNYEVNLRTVAIKDQGRRLGEQDDQYAIVRLDDKAIIETMRELTKSNRELGKKRVRDGSKPSVEDDFGGFDTFPKGLDWNAFVAGVRENEQKIRTQVPGYKLDQKEVAFWDETTSSYRLLVADSEAIRRELSEQTKLMNQQITGVFNVPTGGEAMVAFFALQQGLVQAGTENGTSGGSTAGGAGRGQVGGGQNALLPYLSRPYGVKGRPGLEKMIGDDDDGERRMTAPKGPLNARPTTAPKGVGQAVNVNNVINLRNIVMLDGRIIVNQLLREFQRSLRNQTQVSGGGGRNNLGV